MIYGYARVSATPSYPSSLLCGTVGIGCKKVDWSEVVLRNGYVYKKFATEKFTGEVTGQEQYKVVKGLKEGEYLGFHDSGALWFEGHYENGKKTGQWNSYFENGQLISFHHYENGLLDGPMEYYYKTGQIMMKGSNKDDKKHGKWWIYDIDNIGFLKFERIYENGKITWENGRIISD